MFMTNSFPAVLVTCMVGAGGDGDKSVLAMI